MRQLYLTTAITAALFGAPALAQTAQGSFDWSGPYVGLGYMTGDVTILATTSSTGRAVQAGYLFDQGALVYGAEALRGGVDVDTGFGGTGVNTQLRGLLGYNMGKTLIFVNLGYARAELLNSLIGDLRDTGISKGIGLRYAVTDQISFGIDYSTLAIDDFDGTGVDLDTRTWAYSVSYHF